MSEPAQTTIAALAADTLIEMRTTGLASISPTRTTTLGEARDLAARFGDHYPHVEVRLGDRWVRVVDQRSASNAESRA